MGFTVGWDGNQRESHPLALHLLWWDFIPHVQTLQGLRPGQGVPWVQEVHAHRLDHQGLAFQALPISATIAVSPVILTSFIFLTD